MNIPPELSYTKDHEWTRFEGSIVTIGITDFAQGELGDIIFVECPDPGSEIHLDDPFGTIEAVKTVADLFAPLTGKILEVNPALEEAPELVNQDPYGEGWILKIETGNSAEKESLLTAEAYEKFIS